MNARKQAIRNLTDSGYVLKRNGANHDIFYNDELKTTIPLKRHDFNENDLNYINKEIKQNRSRKG